MIDETVTPETPVDPRDNVAATGQPTPPVEPDSAPPQGEQPESTDERVARLERTNLRLASENNALRARLDKALGRYQPVRFPCTVYRGGVETTANGEAELVHLIVEGWSESKG